MKNLNRMRYLLDNHSLSNKIMSHSSKRTDLYVLNEIVDEYAYTPAEAQKVARAGIQILSIEKKHLEKMKEIMQTHGGNLKLIRLYTSKGTGDVAMLAYVIAEKEMPETLFYEPYTLVTQDKELRLIAESYGIPCLATL